VDGGGREVGSCGEEGHRCVGITGEDGIDVGGVVLGYVRRGRDDGRMR
jgi:hypothetical protein